MSEVVQRGVQEALDVAASMGLECFLPEMDELMLDLDGEGWKYTLSDGDPRSLTCSNNIVEVMKQNNFIIEHTLVTISKSGNEHVYLKLNRFVGPLQRITLQSLLGSDPTRELLSLIRLDTGSDAPTALFETKRQAQRVKNWRARITTKETL